MNRGQPTLCATEVTPIFDTSVPDPENHREVSEVVKLIPGAAFVRRRHGDEAFLTLDGVAPEHKHNWHKLEVGQHVWSGFRAPEDGRRLYLAAEAEFYSREEEQELYDNSQR